MSTVDVVVPCYNYARFLERCVSSITGQDEVDVRILIIDDHSNDDTPATARALAERDPRVHYRRHAANRGHIATYNEGLLEWAAAKYCVLLSADDMLAPGALARATRIMDEHSEVDLAYGMARVIGDEMQTAAEEQVSDEIQLLTGARFLERCFRHGNPVPTPAAVVRTKTQQRLGGYRADLPHTGDMEMWMRFAAHGPVAVVRPVQAYYRWHGGNMSVQYYAGLLGDAREQMQACKEVLERWRDRLPASANQWLELIAERTGTRAFWTASKAFDEGNMEAYRACLSFAAECYPPLRRQQAWWRLRAKALLGHSSWRRLQPVLDRLRGVTAVAAPSALTYNRVGQQIGWWPTVA